MKKILISFMLVFSLSFAMIFAASAAKDESVKELTVIGNGSVTVPADTVIINFGIDSRGDSIDSAIKESEEIYDKIETNCGKYGALCKESFYTYYDSCTGKQTVSVYYSILSHNPEITAEIIGALSGCGVTSVNCISYTVSDTQKAKSEALRLAIKDAEVKARAISDRLKITEISEIDSYCGVCQSDCKRNITIEARVSVRFD